MSCTNVNVVSEVQKELAKLEFSLKPLSKLALFQCHIQKIFVGELYDHT